MGKRPEDCASRGPRAEGQHYRGHWPAFQRVPPGQPCNCIPEPSVQGQSPSCTVTCGSQKLQQRQACLPDPEIINTWCTLKRKRLFSKSPQRADRCPNPCDVYPQPQGGPSLGEYFLSKRILLVAQLQKKEGSGLRVIPRGQGCLLLLQQGPFGGIVQQVYLKGWAFLLSAGPQFQHPFRDCRCVPGLVPPSSIPAICK